MRVAKVVCWFYGTIEKIELLLCLWLGPFEKPHFCCVEFNENKTGSRQCTGISVEIISQAYFRMRDWR